MSALHKNILVSALSGLMLLGGSHALAAEAASPEKPVSVMLQAAKSEHLNVYKSPTCGCCGDWIEHAEKNGFETKTFHPQNLTQMKLDMGIQGRFHSCHTAVSESGYLFEGHVPAKLVKQFLASPPEGALGLTAPGMPMGSPGMEVDDRFQPYQVLLMKKDGGYEIYATIEQQDQQY
ncbi:DUF411 domain-containing protein [Marinobacterium sediminicola]|uniref:Uncharacterized conserved protein n=1 Tax=Marinobacterium sediminicola TaxID=518898 RepID=A0ABY1S263_9GAMM|nr:DUF411 domain-containing protein [Marinobacterium sediminicola]ULG68512.1 DUF411 domain-containing protein [Marinobacterium sediminicola]SMR76668.1 Uncharacterized conserved protein [Marinobacterium sediminicola]